MRVYLEPNDIAGWSNRFALPALSDIDEAIIRSFDDKLVVYASTEEPYYRVARRGMCPGWVSRRAAFSVDHKICHAYNLDPITSVYPANISQGNPWPRALNELAERDMFRIASARRAGGAIDNCGNLYTDHQEEREAARDRSWRRGVDGEVDARAHDSYGLFARRSGQRVYMSDPVERAKHRLDRGARVPEVRQQVNAGGGIMLTDA